MRGHFLNYTLVGMFVTVMVAALVWSVASISGRTGPTDSYSILMDNVTDIGFGTLVRYEGYQIGQIEAILAEWSDDKYRFRLVVSVQKGWHVPKDSIARIGSSSFLAAKTVEISAGKSTELIAIGGDIPSGPSTDIFSLMASVAADIGDLSESSLKPLIARVGDIIGRLGDKTEGNLDELFASLIAVAKEIEAEAPVITADINKITVDLRAITADIQVITGKAKFDLDQVAKFVSDGNAQAVENILSNLEQASQDATKVSGDVKQVSAKIKDLADEARAILAENRGNVGKSVENLEYILRSVSQNIDSLAHNLDGTARNLNEFSRLIRQQPGLLLSGGTPEADRGLVPSGEAGQSGE